MQRTTKANFLFSIQLVPGSSECVFLEALNIAREIATLSPVAVVCTQLSIHTCSVRATIQVLMNVT